jgi:L-malate glycosyltransferase
VTAVHQLLPVLSPGDAIGGAALRTRAMLRDLGFRSEIFAEIIDQRLVRDGMPPGRLVWALEPGDAVLYHLSIGSPLARMVERLTARVVIVYHNITPAAYYRDISPRVVYWLERGREDLARLAPRAALVIGDSTFNLSEASALGARDGVVIPPPVDLSRLSPVPARPDAREPVILFVGRVAPNKGHADLIRALAALRAKGLPAARLVLAGNANDTRRYLAALLDLAERLGVREAVSIPGTSMSDSALHQQYAGASVFACASEHEGFCVPLLEAMSFSVPIVAYAAGAVPETLDGAGLLTSTKDPLVWAAMLHRVICDEPLRDALVSAGHRRLADFDGARITARLKTALAGAGITAS